MRCIAVAINSIPLCEAGVVDASIISASISGYLRGNQPATLDVRGMCELRGGRAAHVYWREDVELSIGDAVRLTFYETETPTAPMQITPTDSPEYIEQQRAFAEFEKTPFVPPKPLPISFANLSIDLRLNGNSVGRARFLPDQEHILGTLIWEKWHPHRCRTYVRSFAGFPTDRHGEETDWYRGDLANGDSLEFAIGA